MAVSNVDSVRVEVSTLGSLNSEATGNSERIFPAPLGISEQSLTVHSWRNLSLVGEKKAWNVLLKKSGDYLFYEIQDIDGNMRASGPISSGNLTPELMCSYITACEPIVENEGLTVTFSPPLVDWKFPALKIRCLQGSNELFWQIRNSDANIYTYFPFKLTFPSARCSEISTRSIKILAQASVAQVKKELKDYTCSFCCEQSLDTFITQHPEFKLTGGSDYNCHAIFDENSEALTIQLTNVMMYPQSAFNLVKVGVKGPQDFSWTPSSEPFLVYFYQENQQTKLLFLTAEQAQKLPWRHLHSIFSAKVTTSIDGYYLQRFKHTIVILPNSSQISLFQSNARLFQGYAYLHSHNNAFELTIPRIVTRDLPSHYLYKLEVEPIHSKSEFDASVFVTRLRWGITLFAKGGSYGNHAQVAVEGISDGTLPDFKGAAIQKGDYFRLIFHYTGSEIKAKLLRPEEKIKAEQRTHIMLLPKENVCEMLSAVKTAIPPSYDTRGIDSIRTQGHNCFTWARDILKIAGVDLGKSFVGFIVTATTQYTSPIERYRPQNEKI